MALRPGDARLWWRRFARVNGNARFARARFYFFQRIMLKGPIAKHPRAQRTRSGLDTFLCVSDQWAAIWPGTPKRQACDFILRPRCKESKVCCTQHSTHTSASSLLRARRCVRYAQLDTLVSNACCNHKCNVTKRALFHTQTHTLTRACTSTLLSRESHSLLCLHLSAGNLSRTLSDRNRFLRCMSEEVRCKRKRTQFSPSISPNPNQPTRDPNARFIACFTSNIPHPSPCARADNFSGIDRLFEFCNTEDAVQTYVFAARSAIHEAPTSVSTPYQYPFAPLTSIQTPTRGAGTVGGSRATCAGRRLHSWPKK